MKQFVYKKIWINVLTPEVLMLLTKIHEFKGKQEQFLEIKTDILSQLANIAKIESIESSNQIEGIITTNKRLNAIAKDKTMPKNRNESEIAGYRDVLNMINKNYEYIPIKSTTILQLHRDLYKFEGYNIGGKYKVSDNVIEEKFLRGNKTTRFKPLSVLETPDAMQNLCNECENALNDNKIEPLIVIPMFILDFLCIRPFNDGNGRMSRLLTLLMLYRSGYTVGKYISIEHLIEKTKNAYYDNLNQSSISWHENKNNYIPFVKYMLRVIVAAYKNFADNVKTSEDNNLSKPERIAKLIEDTYGEITKTEIMAKYQDISQITIQRTLADLLEKNDIIKLSGGRYTKYIWNREKE